MLNEVVGLLLVVPIYFIFFVFALRSKNNIFQHTILAVFFVYLGLVVAITLFPFPIQADVILENRELQHLSNNFIPFKGMMEIINSGSYVVIRNILGNIILTIPFGMLLPFLLEKAKNIRYMFFAGLCFTLTIESLQFILSTLLGYTYKITDIDDVILNLTGAMIGYICFRLVKFIIKG